MLFLGLIVILFFFLLMVIFKLLIFKELLFDFSVLSIDFLFLVLIEIEDVLLKIFDSDFLIVVLFLFFDLFVLK